MAKKFAIPFANSGDKTAVPDGVQPDGSVSYTAGFGPDYELDKALDPVNAKDVPRDQTNQLFFDLTDAVGEIQKFGYALWSTDLSPYALNAEVFHNGILWRSTSASNSGEPGVAATWIPDSAGLTSVTMTSANVTLTAQQAARSIIIITGTLTANVQLIFPTYVKQWQVINNTTGNFTITCKTAAGSGVAAIQGQSVNIVGDGVNIIYGSQNIEDSGWLTPSLQNSYTFDSANPIRYRKIGKLVQITGAVRRSAAISGLQTIFTLPVGFRPSKASQVASPIWVYDNLATQLCGAGIGTDGGLNTGFVINLAGTPSGAGGFSVNASFLVD